MTNVEKPVWFITGCSTGFGRELVTLLLRQGARVVATARDVTKISGLVEDHEDDALALPLDVTDADAITHAVRQAEAKFGRIDVLVNNAGYGYFGAIEEGEDPQVRTMFDTNVFGLIDMTKAVLPGMRARHSGFVVNLSSIGGLVAFPGTGYYTATKHAVEALSEALSQEVAPLGIRVLIVEPRPLPHGFRPAGPSTCRRPSSTNMIRRRVSAGARPMRGTAASRATRCGRRRRSSTWWPRPTRPCGCCLACRRWRVRARSSNACGPISTPGRRRRAAPISPATIRNSEGKTIMRLRKLGAHGPEVSEIGLGCMGMSAFYSGRDESESTLTLERAVELGVTFFDTADMYGMGENEELVGRVLKPHRDRIVLATKFGNSWTADRQRGPIRGDAAYVRQACDASLKRLGFEVIDLLYQHRVDPRVPIEETVGAMADLVKAGKVRYLGLSEAGPETIRRAHKTHPIAALQTEYSLWSREPETEILSVTRELGISFVPYSPLGRGFLTGHIKSPEDLEPDDWRRNMPRFQGENFQKNVDLASKIHAFASARDCTPAQLALAWVLAQGNDIIPIPGTKRRKFLEENMGAATVVLTPAELAEIDRILPPTAFAGERYPTEGMRALNL